MRPFAFLVRLALACGLCTIAFAHAPATAARASLDRHHVREMQQALAVLGFDPGPADGVLGPRTREAVTRFQKAEGLSSTGSLDAETASRLSRRQRDHVRSVQEALKKTGYDPGVLDGLMGEQTKAALRRYAAAPAPSAPSRESQLIEQFRRLYGSSLQQSP